MNLLALRGGGPRGLISIMLLKKIEELTGKAIHELFHYFGGSSVGTLLTSALLLSDDEQTAKYTAHQVYELFLKHVYSSFSWSYYQYIISSGFGLYGPRYSNVGLKSIVEECCGDSHVSHLLKPFIFPAYDRISNRAYYFDKHKDHELKIKDVIMGCTSIPTYFPSYKTKINDRECDFLDSALIANDPSLLLYLKASNEYPEIPKSNIYLLTIGTGQFPNVVNEKNGILSWLPTIASTLITASEENEQYQLSLSLSRDNQTVLDVPLNATYSPDDIRKETIEYYIKTTNEWIENNEEMLKTYCDKLVKNL